MNQPGVRGITGTGNNHLLIRSSQGSKVTFNLWLLDSGRYAPDTIAGQDFEGYPTWDWLRFDQVAWYYETSKKLEEKLGYKVPSLMFIHIPLWEYRFMWYASVEEGPGPIMQEPLASTRLWGNGTKTNAPVRSIAACLAILARGDVKGVFCGHDHVNTYHGNYYGVLLGYAGSMGFGTYGLPGADRNRLRGARIFHLDEHARTFLPIPIWCLPRNTASILPRMTKAWSPRRFRKTRSRRRL